MTSRRSIQTNAGRTSRAFQFVPGHVGGRVDSAQPVRRRRTVGGMTRPIGSPPVGGINYLVEIIADASLTVPLPAAPAGTTHAVAIVHARSHGSVSVPAGWSLLATGAYSSIARYVVVGVTDWTGAEGLDFVFGDYNGDTYGCGGAAVAYFTGGTGGVWSLVDGPTYGGVSSAGFAEVPAGSPAWVQFAACCGVYTVGSIPSGVSYNKGFAVNYIYPSGPTLRTGSAFTSAMASPQPTSALWDWNSIGAYGTPSSVAFAAIWTP